MNKLYITSVKKSIYSDRKDDLYLYEDEEKAENSADRADERNTEEWSDYEERNTWYSSEEGEHFVEPDDDTAKPDYPKYASFEYEEIDFNDERVKALVENNKCFISDETKSYLTEYFATYGTKQEQEYSLFDDELSQLANGKITGNHIFNLGKPSEILQKCGFPKDLRIELSSSRLMLKATQGNHPFDIEDIKGLDKALRTPVAVFEYGNKANSQNVIVELQKDAKNFLVGVFFNQKQRGYEVSDIRGLFNRDNLDWMRWIEQGKMIYGNKDKIQVLTAQQRTNPAEVNGKEARTSSDSYYLDSVDSLIRKFGNVKDIFTEDFDFYKENKERYEIFKKFRAVYQELESVETADTPMMAKEFHDALKSGNKNVLLKYTDGELYPEIAQTANKFVFEYNLEHSEKASYSKTVWNDYLSLVRSLLPKDNLNDKNKVLSASKVALAYQVDVEGAINIINKEFEKRGVRNETSLVKAIKEATYPELTKKINNRKPDEPKICR